MHADIEANVWFPTTIARIFWTRMRLLGHRVAEEASSQLPGRLGGMDTFRVSRTSRTVPERRRPDVQA